MGGKCKPETRKKYFLEHLESHTLAVAKYRSKKSGVNFSIATKDIVFPELCPLLGVKIYRGTVQNNSNSPSLDRIDNSLGYIPGNVWVISRKANSMKSDATIEQLRTFAKNVLKLFPE